MNWMRVVCRIKVILHSSLRPLFLSLTHSHWIFDHRVIYSLEVCSRAVLSVNVCTCDIEFICFFFRIFVSNFLPLSPAIPILINILYENTFHARIYVHISISFAWGKPFHVTTTGKLFIRLNVYDVRLIENDDNEQSIIIIIIASNVSNVSNVEWLNDWNRTASESRLEEKKTFVPCSM